MDYKVFGICKDELSIAQYHMGNKAVLIISGLVLQEITDIFGPIAGYNFFNQAHWKNVSVVTFVQDDFCDTFKAKHPVSVAKMCSVLS